MKKYILQILAVIAFSSNSFATLTREPIDVDPVDETTDEVVFGDSEDNPPEEVITAATIADPAVVAKLTQEYMDLVNAHRTSIGRGTLVHVDNMQATALQHSSRMAIGKVAFGHTGSGSRCRVIKRSMGSGNLCGEIVAWGQKTPHRVFRAWLNSPGHRRIMEGKRYTHTGMGFARNKKGRIYWTQIFLEVR